MSYWAIGLPGEKPRMFITGTAEMAELQLQVGETYVDADAVSNGIISENGEAFEETGVDLANEEIKIRSYRTALLAASDWTQFPDSPLTEEKKAEWAAYRQALRDLPEDQSGLTFEEIEWPEKP